MPNIESIIEMIEKNIFRPSAVVKKSGSGEPGDDEEILVDPAWPHLQVSLGDMCV